MDGKQADNYAGQGTGGRGVRNRERTKLMENNSVGAARGQAWVEVGNNGKRTPSLGILPRRMALQGCRFAYSSIFHSEDNCSTPGAPTLPTHPAKELVGPTACFCVACQLRVVDTFLNSEKELHDVNYTDSSSSAHQHSSVGTRPSSSAYVTCGHRTTHLHLVSRRVCGRRDSAAWARLPASTGRSANKSKQLVPLRLGAAMSQKGTKSSEVGAQDRPRSALPAGKQPPFWPCPDPRKQALSKVSTSLTPQGAGPPS